MRLAIVDSARPGTLGGIERAFVSLARHAAAAGHVVECIGRPGSGFVGHARAHGLQGRELPLRSPWDPLSILGLAMRLRALRADVALVTLNRDAQFCWLAGRLAGRPRVAILKGLPMMRNRVHHRFLYRRCVDVILAPTHWLKDQVERFPFARGLRIEVLPDGIDTSRFPSLAELPQARRAARAALGVPAGRAVFAGIGHLIPRKNFSAIVPLLAELGNGVNWELWLVGDGPEEAALRAQAAAAGLDSRVKFLGRREDVPALLLAVDVLLVPSLEEQFPLCILEARRAGVPRVLVTPVGAAGDMEAAGATVLPLRPGGPWVGALRAAAAEPGACDAPAAWDRDDTTAQARRLQVLESLLEESR